MGALSTYQASKFVIMLSKPFSQWPEFKSGIIDENGNLIKKDSNKKQLDVFTNLVRKIKIVLEKAIGKNRLLHNAISLMLIHESPDLTDYQNTQLNIKMAECITSSLEIDILREIQEALVLKGAQILHEETQQPSANIKKFSDIFSEDATFFNKGDKVKINLSGVCQYIDTNKLGGEDAGIVIRADKDSYLIKFSNSNVLRIYKSDVYSIGDVDSE